MQLPRPGTHRPPAAPGARSINHRVFAAVPVITPTALALALCLALPSGLASASNPGAAASGGGEDASTSPDADASAERDALERLVGTFADAVIVPHHEALAAAGERLAAAGRAFDAAPDERSLTLLRAAWLEMAATWAGGRAIAFGPVDSLGHGTALDSPLDEGGLARVLDGTAGDGADDPEHPGSTPSLQGLNAMSHLLHGGGDRDAGDYTAAERRYLARLTVRAARLSAELLGIWRDGLADRPPFAARLATAGEPHNVAYPSLEAGAEEIVRALLGHLDVLVDEELPALVAEAAALADAPRPIALALLEGAVRGADVAYLAPSGPGDWLASVAPAADGAIRRALADAAEGVAWAIAGRRDAVALGASLERVGTALDGARSHLARHTLEERLFPVSDVMVPIRSSSAYEAAPPNLGARGAADHELGDTAFEEAFVLTSGHASSGLGPTFNNTSCVGCHVRNGRGMPVPGQLLLRVSDAAPGGKRAAAGESDTLVLNNAPPVAGLGNQIQDFAVAGAVPEARVEIGWREHTGRYADGSAYRLRSPTFDVTLLESGEKLPDSVSLSPRVPPHVYGLGLLEAIPEADILALADPADRDGDGVSGRPNRVWDERAQGFALGRFGWKANSPNLFQQTADAYLNDMGIHSPLFPAEDGSVEIDAATLAAATAYSQTLAAPARTGLDDPLARRGEALFTTAGCNACHVERFVTGRHEYPALANQTIRPYTDLLLHDMGEGLADGRADYAANGREWRTPSLWGIGLVQTVLPFAGYLHDGRARTLEEAILWHGGEGEGAKLAFSEMAVRDREALVRFLRSL